MGAGEIDNTKRKIHCKLFRMVICKLADHPVGSLRQSVVLRIMLFVLIAFLEELMGKGLSFVIFNFFSLYIFFNKPLDLYLLYTYILA